MHNPSDDTISATISAYRAEAKDILRQLLKLYMRAQAKVDNEAYRQALEQLAVEKKRYGRKAARTTPGK